MQIVAATGNEHKIVEMSSILAPYGIEVLGAETRGGMPEVNEDGDTFKENAVKKAMTCARLWKCPVIADDSGLEVMALGGAPGVHSARYAGEAKDPEANMAKLLQKLNGASNRKARFRTVISLIIDGEEHLFEGIVNGKILTEKHGEKGFGYDPIFQPEGYDRSFAELTMEEKNAISHRGRAVEKLYAFLKDYSQKKQ